jgi:hypothetical protein
MGLQKRTCAGKQLAEKFGMGQERRTSGAEALIGSPGTARLKSCPDTEHQSSGYLKHAHFRRLGIDVFENSSHARSFTARLQP